MHYSYNTLLHEITMNEDQEITGTGITKKYIEEEFFKQDNVDLGTLLDDLKLLDEWHKAEVTKNPEALSENVTGFFVFFQDAVLGAYFRFRHSKGRAWSKKRNIIMFVCTALLPIFATSALQFVTGNTKELLASTGVIAVSIIIVAWMFTHVYSEWQKMNSHKETWVRHSACYGRLRLALSSFLISPRSEEDYKVFIAKTFSILEQNYNQFMINMSGNGLAKSSGSNSNKEQ